MKQLAIIVSILGVFLAVSGVAYGDDGLVFVAHLSGAQEVTGEAPILLAPQPGIDTDTIGRFRIQFNAALTKADFRLTVDGGVGIIVAHLHCAPAGANGPPMVFLFGPAAPVDIDGLLSEGELTNDSFEAGVDCTPTCGKTVNNIASLQAAILDGCIYANVHSVVNTGGEVRGQVRPAEQQ